MKEETIVRNIIDTCHLVHNKGLVSGSGGNISVRQGNEIWITPSGMSFEMLKLGDIVRINMDGEYEGNIRPSKEISMHLNCYKTRENIKAVVHVHSVYAVALSCLKNTDSNCVMPMYTPGYSLRVGNLPVLPYMIPGSMMLAQASAEAILNRNSVLLGNHGLLTVGSTIEEALNLAEEIEENAQIHFIVGDKGQALNQQQVEQLKISYS